jgi:hypothetical protein
MRQRFTNFSGAMRDMRNHRSPEQMLIREMLAALKQAEEMLADIGLFADDEPRVTFRRVIAKAERHTNG